TICVVLVLEGFVEPFAVDVKRIGILHREFPDAEQPRFGPGLVPELGLNLIPDLGELSIRVQSIPRDGGKDLLVGHAQGHITALPVPQAKQVIAHHVPATGLFPDFRGMQSWEQEFLSPDAVHLLSDDAYYLEADALSQRQQRIDTGSQ